jgi:hypothetical protein
MNILSQIQTRIFSNKQKHTTNILKESTKIPELPDPSTKQSANYELIGGTVIQITNKFYQITEPLLTNTEKEKLNIIKNGLFEILNIQDDKNIYDYIEKSTRVIISELDLRLSKESLKKIIYYIKRDIIGLGKIEAIINDSFVTGIKFDSSLQVTHKIYGSLNTDILLNEAEFSHILRKLALLCNSELSPLKTQVKGKTKDLEIEIKYSPQLISKSTFYIHKITDTKPFPLQLIQERKISPEIYAYFWLLIENKRNIFFVEDSNILNSLTYFLTPHSSILTNLEDYETNLYTSTKFGEEFNNEDFFIVSDPKNLNLNTTFLASLRTVQEKNNVVCYVQNGKIIKIKENGIELFVNQEGKFYYNLERSDFVKLSGSKDALIKEFQTRTRLIMALAQSKQNPESFRKTIRVYKDNPVAVLQKLGII